MVIDDHAQALLVSNFKEFILDARPRLSLCEAEIEVRRKLIM
jgi:hypothetical protein